MAAQYVVITFKSYWYQKRFLPPEKRFHEKHPAAISTSEFMHPEIANDNVSMLKKSKPYQLSSSKKLDIQKR